MAILRLALVILCSLAVWHPSAWAQGPSTSATPDQRQTYEALFQASLRDPANVELAVRFADSASKVGDFEAAIGALERILFYNPSLGRARLELGVLYFRLGSFAQSRSYLEAALAQPDVPAETTSRVRSFLAEIERRDRTSAFSGFAQFGVRHQTNANSAPSSLNVRVFGFEGILDPRFRRRPDWNAFVLTGFRHVLDFENQRGDTWETSFQAYATRQFKFTELDLALAEITTGPRLALAPDLLPGAGIRPYAILSGIALGGRAYSSTAGAGASVSLPTPIPASLLEFGAEYRRRLFYTSSVLPTANGQSGHLNTVFANLTGQVAPGLRFGLRAYGIHNVSAERFSGFRQTGIDVSLSYDFDPLFIRSARSWTISPFVSRAWSDYKEPNPIVDPTVKRRDNEWRFGVGLDMPVFEHVGFATQIVWSETRSNLPNHRTKNVAIAFGPTFRF